MKTNKCRKYKKILFTELLFCVILPEFGGYKLAEIGLLKSVLSKAYSCNYNCYWCFISIKMQSKSIIVFLVLSLAACQVEYLIIF